MFINKCLLGLSLCLAVSFGADAQTHSHQLLAKTRAQSALFLRNYNDSLHNFRRFQDSLRVDTVQLRATRSQYRKADDINIYALLLPPTFYVRVAADNLRLDREPTLVDDAFFHLYLHNPVLVSGTDVQLRNEGKMIQPDVVEVKHVERLAEKVAPKPEETAAEPIGLMVVKPNFWSFSGNQFLQFLQNYVSDNWYKGGESNYSVLGSLELNANYNNKQKVQWANKLELKLGFQTSKEDTVHNIRTSENLIRLTSKFGLQAASRWYYTLQMTAYTQFVRQWNRNSDVVTTDFMGPLNVNLSLGMDYNVDWLKHRLKGSVHMAPIAYNFKYVNRLSLASRYGIDEGKHALHDLGSQVTLDLTWTIAENISWRCRLYGYTTYHRSELELENTFSLKVNKWISTNIFVYPRFDDGADRIDNHSYWQLKEYASVGFSYSF